MTIAQKDSLPTTGPSPLTLSDAAQALGCWPGAVVELDRDGVVVGANDPGWQLADCLFADGGKTMRDLMALAVEAEGATSDYVELNIDGTPRWFDCVVLPGADGRTILLARDQTYDLNIRKALFESRQRYRDLVVISSDFAWETDIDGKFVFVSPHGALGYTAEELVGHHPREFILEEDADLAKMPFFCKEPVTSSQVWLRDAEGEETCLIASAVPVHGPDGEWLGVRGLCRDITHERLRDAALAQAKVREQVVAYVVSQVRDEARPQAMLEAAVAMLGRATSAAAAVYSRSDTGGYEIAATYGEWPAEEMPDEIDRQLVHTLAPYACTYNGHSLLVCTTRYRGAGNGAIMLARPARDKEWSDDDEAMLSAVAGQLAIGLRQIADQEELERLSNTDGLTGLMNRRAFHQALEEAVARALRNATGGALVYVDLDHFKSINDTYGHEFGDQVLCEVAQILHENSRAYDLVARLGGDEFVIWFDNMDAAAARQRAEGLSDTLKQLNRHSRDGMPVLGASVGLAPFDPAEGENTDQLISRADRAMYEVKHGAPGRDKESGRGND